METKERTDLMAVFKSRGIISLIMCMAVAMSSLACVPIAAKDGEIPLKEEKEPAHVMRLADEEWWSFVALCRFER